MLAVISGSTVKAASKPWALKSDAMIFTLSKKKDHVELNYSLNKQLHTAVTLQGILKSKMDKLHYSVAPVPGKPNTWKLQLNGNGQQGSLIVKVEPHSRYLEISHFQGLNKLVLRFNSSALVLPDPQGENLVVYPDNYQRAQLLIPGNNHLLLNMLDNGNAMLSCIWNNTAIKLIENRATDHQTFSSLVLQPQPGDTLWLKIDAAPEIWKRLNKPQTAKATRLNWKPPFPAVWQVTFRKKQSDIIIEENQCDSWKLFDLDVPNPHHTSGYLGVWVLKAGGTTWSSALDYFAYPFFKKSGKYYLLLPKYREATTRKHHQQPNSYDSNFKSLIYPVQSTDIDRQAKYVLPYDAQRRLLNVDTLKLLNCVLSPLDVHRATCGSTEKIEKIFYNDAQQAKHQQIYDYCKDMQQFIANYHQRIEQYQVWRKDCSQTMQTYLKKHPKSATTLQPLIAGLAQAKTLYDQTKGQIKNLQYFNSLTTRITKISSKKLDNEAQGELCKKLCRKIRTVGGAQDHLTGMMRSIAKSFKLRLTALLLTASETELRQLLMTLHQQTATLMHSRFKMEAK
jgi:hypothetical protein